VTKTLFGWGPTSGVAALKAVQDNSEDLYQFTVITDIQRLQLSLTMDDLCVLLAKAGWTYANSGHNPNNGLTLLHLFCRVNPNFLIRMDPITSSWIGPGRMPAFAFEPSLAKMFGCCGGAFLLLPNRTPTGATDIKALCHATGFGGLIIAVLCQYTRTRWHNVLKAAGFETVNVPWPDVNHDSKDPAYARYLSALGREDLPPTQIINHEIMVYRTHPYKKEAKVA